MKKYLAALLAGAALSAMSSGILHAEGKVIGVSWVQKSGRDAEDTAIRTAVEAAGNSYVSSDAYSSAQKQLTDVESLIGQGVNALIIVSGSGMDVAPAVDKAVAAGIPVLAYGTPVERGDVFYIGFDDRDVGRTLARRALQERPQGSYAFVKGPAGDPSAALMYSSQMQVLQEALAAGAIRNVGEVHTEGAAPSDAQRNMSQILLATDNQVDAVIASNDTIAAGVVAALDRQGLAGTVAVLGQGADKAALNRIALGVQTATIWKDARELGYAAGDIASELAVGKQPGEIAGATDFTTSGGTVVKSLSPPPIAITSDNLDLVIDAGWASKDDVCAGVSVGTVAACD
jgi:D-xylose transport system substrate-binding protein